tara:strand:+ start:34 stop:489 length:456 start_codon:yes stop_codon:yes gene_type:complete
MIAEISLLVSGIKAVNETIATFKEGKDNLDGLAGVFGSLSESKNAIEKIDQQVEQGDHVLTQEEALKLAYCREEVRKQERALKRATPPAVWRDMLHLKSKSEQDAKQKIRAQQKAVAKKTQMIRSLAEGVAFWAVLVALAVSVIYYTGIYG